ncbi:MAG: hypothetical protein IAE78_10510 [Myxococcus sp.]|nr:hypothetical protein [Myxococcus sp.]
MRSSLARLALSLLVVVPCIGCKTTSSKARERWPADCDRAVRERAPQQRLRECAARLPANPRFVLVADPEADLPWGVLPQVAMQFHKGVRRERSAGPPVGAPFNSLAVWADDHPTPVFNEPTATIDVWTASPDGRFVATVHHLSAGYQGAGVPYLLQDAWVSVLDLTTLTAIRLPLPLRTQEDEEEEGGRVFSPQSLSLAWAEHSLWVLARNTWNGSKDVRRVWQCAVPQGTCADQPNERFPMNQPSVEGTASGGYRIEPLPVGFVLPPGGDRRCVRRSPGGTRVAWVSERITAEKAVARILFVRTGTSDVEVARGESKLTALWLDEDRLAYDEEPTLTPLLASRLAAAGPNPEAQLAAIQGLPDGTHPRDLQKETVAIYDVLRATKATVLGDHVRLLAQPRAANVRGGSNVEVPPL